MPRSGPFSRRRPGRRREPEPADDGRSPGPSQRRRRDRLRHRRDEAGSDQTSGEGPPPGHPSSEEGAEPLPERADAEHSCPRRGRPAVRPGLPTRRERLQGYRGRQEAGDRTADHPGRETRGRRGRRDGRFPELRTVVSERAQVSDDRERSDLSWCARRRREVPRAVSDDAGIVDPPLDGLPWPSAWWGRQTGGGRARRDEHGGGRGLRGVALEARHVGRRILPDGRGDRAGRDDGDPVGRDPRAAQRSVDRIANEDGARGPEPRPWCGPGRLAARDPGAPQPGRMLPPHRAGLQPRGNLSDADHRDLGSLPGRRLPHGREAGLQRPDRPRHVRGEWRGGEGLQAIPPHGERRESSGDSGHERISVCRRDGRAHGEQRAHLRRPRRDPGIRHRAQSDARETDAEARRSAEGHAAPGALGPEDADLTLIHWGSTWGAAHEAIQNVEGRGIRVNSLEFPTLFPFHTDATLALLKDVKQSLAIEGNYTGQFTRLLRSETGYKPDHFFGKYDGEPFTWRDIADKILEAVA